MSLTDTRKQQPWWIELAWYAAAVVVFALLVVLDRRMVLGFGVKACLVAGSMVLVTAGLLSPPARRAVAGHEFAAFFYSPIAYVVLCLFIFLADLLFLLTVFAAGQPAELRWLFVVLIWVLIAVAPAISMRLLAEEQRSGTLETLMTSPLTDGQVILGKWLGGLGFYAVLLLPTLVLVVILEIFAQPDYGPLFTSYVGLLLVGGLYLAIGTFASVWTRNQIIAFLITVFIILLLTVATYFLRQVVPVRIAAALDYLNVNLQYDAFSRGLIDTSNFVYFFSGIVLFLVLAVKTLESRKWR